MAVMGRYGCGAMLADLGRGHQRAWGPLEGLIPEGILLVGRVGSSADKIMNGLGERHGSANP
jgi:hypothetical protein